MKKTILRIFTIILLAIFIVNILNTTIYASALSDAISGGKGFISSADTTGSYDKAKVKAASDSIYNTLLMISFVVVAVVGIILGIKFMMASAEGKADVKKALYIFLIGCVVVYGSFGIWKLMIDILKTV